MNELREQIDQEVYEAYQAGIDHKEVPWKYPAMTKGDIRMVTDRILALIAEAMLSDIVLDAATVGVNRWMMESFGHTGDPFEFSQGELNSLRPKRVEEMKAALAAAGITPGDAREGGEGE